MAERLFDLLTEGPADSTAMVVGESGHRYTYGELAAAVDRLARTLAAIGVGRGSRVGIVLPDGPDCVTVLFAVVALGATAAPLNAAYTRDEYAFYLEDLQPELVLLPERELPAAREAAAGSRIVDVVSGGDAPPRFQGGDRQAGYEPAQPDDVALLLHTSGTTSRPKQVPLTQRNLAGSAEVIARFYELGPDDVSYCAMPLFHVHGLVASTFAALAGQGSVVVPRTFLPRRFWEQTRTYGATWYSAGPTLHQMILDRIDSEGAAPSFRFARSCSSALSPTLMRRLEQTLGVPVLEAYGMTEASHQMASNPLPPAPHIPGSVGVSAGAEIAIADAAGALLPIGQSGEVVIRGPGVTAGYLNNPQANAESFFDGWFRTGDWGSLDPQGYLRLEGRIKEMILRGGENISPYEIEEVLLSHPAVSDACCFGVDDEKYGERVGAAVALSGEAAQEDLVAHCRARLAAFKVPDVIHILDAIPRTATGKVQRKRVGESLTEPQANA